MIVSIVPSLIDALVAGARDLFGDALTVCDGFEVGEDPGDYLMVGVDDPESPESAFAANVDQDWASIGARSRDESGHVTCAAMSWNGDADLKAARDGVYATASAFGEMLRNSPALGLDPELLWTSFGTSMQLSQSQVESGAIALLVFQVAFRARI